MNKYISDLHFGHANIIRHSHRPDENVDDMDKRLLQIWHDNINDNDDVWILGDLMFRTKEPKKYLDQLNGKLHLIKGNHDQYIKDRSNIKYFESIDDIRFIQDENTQLVLCHYPMAEWPGYFRNAIHLFGHIHNSENEAKKIMDGLRNCYNVGVDCIGKPMSLKEIIDFYHKST